MSMYFRVDIEQLQHLLHVQFQKMPLSGSPEDRADVGFVVAARCLGQFFHGMSPCFDIENFVAPIHVPCRECKEDEESFAVDDRIDGLSDTERDFAHMLMRMHDNEEYFGDQGGDYDNNEF